MNEENNESVKQVNNVQPNYNQYNPGYNIPEEYQPISMWGYFGYELLFSIPCVGFILLCVFAFGGTRNINLKNFARSYFCFLIIFAVFVVLLIFLFGALGAFTYTKVSTSSVY